MPNAPRNIKDLGNYMALAQVGLEMVAPIGLGLALDYYLGSSPRCVLAGAAVGLVGGIVHLVAITNRMNKAETKQPKDGP